MRNVLARVPRGHHARVKRELSKIFHAPDLAAAQHAVEAFLCLYGDEFPTACETLCRDLRDCLTFYRFPEAHWKHTSNVLERAFKEVRRRTRVAEQFPTERSAPALVWACLEGDRLKWRGVRMSPTLVAAIAQARESVQKEPISIPAAENYLAVA